MIAALGREYTPRPRNLRDAGLREDRHGVEMGLKGARSAQVHGSDGRQRLPQVTGGDIPWHRIRPPQLLSQRKRRTHIPRLGSSGSARERANGLRHGGE